VYYRAPHITLYPGLFLVWVTLRFHTGTAVASDYPTSPLRDLRYVRLFLPRVTFIYPSYTRCLAIDSFDPTGWFLPSTTFQVHSRSHTPPFTFIGFGWTLRLGSARCTLRGSAGLGSLPTTTTFYASLGYSYPRFPVPFAPCVCGSIAAHLPRLFTRTYRFTPAGSAGSCARFYAPHCYHLPTCPTRGCGLFTLPLDVAGHTRVTRFHAYAGSPRSGSCWFHTYTCHCCPLPAAPWFYLPRAVLPLLMPAVACAFWITTGLGLDLWFAVRSPYHTFCRLQRFHGCYILFNIVFLLFVLGSPTALRQFPVSLRFVTLGHFTHARCRLRLHHVWLWFTTPQFYTFPGAVTTTRGLFPLPLLFGFAGFGTVACAVQLPAVVRYLYYLRYFYTLFRFAFKFTWLHAFSC